MTTSVTGLTGPEQIDKWLSRLAPLNSPTKNHRLKHELHKVAAELQQRIPSNTAFLRWEETAEYYSATRSLELQHLIRRFVLQLRYGCENPKCTSKFCFTWRELHARYPARRPSHLTARMMAHNLATGDDPHAKLCRKGKRLLPGDLDLGADLQQAIHEKWSMDSLAFVYTIFWDPGKISPSSRSMVQLSEKYVITPMLSDRVSRGPGQHGRSNDWVMKLARPSRPRALWDYWMNSLEQNGVPKPDRKSLSQKLFSTFAVKLFEWKSLATNMQFARETIGGEGNFAVGRTATALPVDSSDADVARSICPSLPSAVLPVKGTILSADGVDQLEVTLPKDMHPPSSFSKRDDSTEKPTIETHPSVTQSKPRPKNEICGTKGPPEDGKTTSAQISHANVRSRGIPKLDSMAISADDVTEPARVYLVDLGNQQYNEQAHLVDLTTLTLLALRDACIEALPPSHFGPGQPKDIDPVLWQYVSNTLFQGFGTTEGLLRSFSGLEYMDPEEVWEHLEAFHWHHFSPDTIMNYLWEGIEDLFTPPPGLTAQGSVKSTLQHSRRSKTRYLNDSEALHMIMICVFALVGSVRLHIDNVSLWFFVDVFHLNRGIPFEVERVWQTPMREIYHEEAKSVLDVLDAFHSDAALRLAGRLVRAIAARRAFYEMEHGSHRFPLMARVMKKFLWIRQSRCRSSENGPTAFGVETAFICWLRMLIMQNWDGDAEVNRWDTAGAAVEILADFVPHANEFDMSLPALHFELIEKRMYMTEIIPNYIAYKTNKNKIHLLNLPFLFSDQNIIHNFRALNYSRLSDAYREVGYMRAFTDRVSFAPDFNRHSQIDEKLEKALSRYLVLDVRREHVLEDTMDQLWGREKRELLRPLKVQMGMDEGEQGQDQGGVSQEFFRVVFQKAFDPDAGLFITDPDSQMSWFRPMSMEPLATYELLGLLVSLGIYNGITLPLSFPLAFYARLLNQPSCKTRHIQDGWPALSKGLQQLLDWNEGDVSEVIMRDYVFSFESNGQTYHIDMDAKGSEKPPTIHDATLSGKETKEFRPVTNKNRESYVGDYISWLTDRSIRPQFSAFERGFRTCLNEKALSILTAPTLMRIAEGFHDFDIAALERHTQYEDYTPDHPLMNAFWEIASSYSKEKQKTLLEFVTASDRVPAIGMAGLRFAIKRNGGDAETLPQSATCFGSLLLPEYSSKEKLRIKLDIALEHSKGFGTL